MAFMQALVMVKSMHRTRAIPASVYRVRDVIHLRSKVQIQLYNIQRLNAGEGESLSLLQRILQHS